MLKLKYVVLRHAVPNTHPLSLRVPFSNRLPASPIAPTHLIVPFDFER